MSFQQFRDSPHKYYSFKTTNTTVVNCGSTADSLPQPFLGRNREHMMKLRQPQTPNRWRFLAKQTTTTGSLATYRKTTNRIQGLCSESSTW